MEEIEAICRRALGAHAKAFPATECGTGMYNVTLRVVGVVRLEATATDLHGVGFDAADVRGVVSVARRHEAVLDEVTEPRMPAGDLWIPNPLLDQHASETAISGTYDCHPEEMPRG